MQYDIIDGVQWLIQEGIVDFKCIVIYGGSYGGYVMLVGIIFMFEFYVCVIDYVGVSNFFIFMNIIFLYWKFYFDMFYIMVGYLEEDEEQM